MPWFNVDDGFHCHPKVLAAGNAAMGMWARLGSYCAKYATNGIVPAAIVKAYGTPGERGRLLDVGWLKPHPDGFEMHDYLDYNRTSDQIAAERAKAAKRKAEQRDRERDRHGVTPPVTDHVTNGVSHSPQAKPSQAKPTVESSITAAAALHGAPAAAAAIRMLIEHKIAAGEANKPTAFRQKMPPVLLAEHTPALADYLDEHPDAEARELAQRVLGLSELDLYRIGAAS